MSELAAVEQVEIAAPLAEVWAYRLDFTNLPEYNPDVSGVERVADGWETAGRPAPGRATPSTWPPSTGRTRSP